MARNDRSEIEWAPRISLARIRMLYQQEAQGICPEELVDEVGTELFWRCESILEFTQAREGKVKCKRCTRNRLTSWIERKTGEPDERLRCQSCGWQIHWRVYVHEAQKRGGYLDAGNAREAFEWYVKAYPACQNYREKIVAVDRLIHEFHWLLVREGKSMEGVKPAGVNLLRGSTSEVLELLDELAYGEQVDPAMSSTREWWTAQKGKRAIRAERDNGGTSVGSEL